MSGSSFLGKYQILGELGKGGFATVYRARDPDLGRDIALKVLDPLLTRDPVWVARFRREAWTVASLDHPRVVAIYEIGQAEGTLYIAMKLVEGGSLKQRIELQGPLPWDEIVRLTGQIAETLDFAHAQGILHRDLKPANVLLDPQFGAVLTDFGFARLMTDNSMSISISGGVVGTPTYIAPELWEDKEPSRQTDVYALGCMIYESVTGQMLFTGSSAPAVMRNHFQPHKFPESWPEGTPQGFAEVLLTALALEPAARYAAADELAAALTGLRDDPLAAPYAELQDAMAQGRWPDVLTLAGQVRSVDAGYRDVVTLEAMALAKLERMERVKQAAGWRAEAEQALADGDFKGAELALQKWQGLTPDDVDCVVFRKKLTQEVRAQESATTSQPKSDGEDQQPLSVVALSGSPPQYPDILETEPTRNGRRRTWLGLALGAVALMAIVVLWPRGGSQGDTATTPQQVAEATSTSITQTAVSTVDSTVVAEGTVQASDTPKPATSTPRATWTRDIRTNTPTASPTVPPTSTTTPTESPTGTVEAQTAAETLANKAIAVRTANLRAGPGTNYAIVGSVDAQEKLDIMGRNQVGDWLMIRTSTGEAWIAATLVQNFDSDSLGVQNLVTSTSSPTSRPVTKTPLAVPIGPDMSLCSGRILPPRELRLSEKVEYVRGLVGSPDTGWTVGLRPISSKALSWQWDGLDQMGSSDWYFDFQYTYGHQPGNPLLRTTPIGLSQVDNEGDIWTIARSEWLGTGGGDAFFRQTCPQEEPNCALHVRIQIAVRNSDGAFVCFASAPSEAFPVPK